MRSFKVVAPFAHGKIAAAQARIAPAGALIDADTASIREDWIRTHPACAADPAWQQGVTDMLAYSETRGWYDAASGLIRAHVEWRPAPDGSAP